MLRSLPEELHKIASRFHVVDGRYTEHGRTIVNAAAVLKLRVESQSKEGPMKTEQVTIRKDRPMPPCKRRGKQPYYPWKTMEIEDSFDFLPHVKWASARVLASRANHYLYPKRFTVRCLGSKSVCWRVA